MSKQEQKSEPAERTININVGVLGHVDSGKTSLSKALSRVASTAAFDKNPQSQERGITLDLGFSAFFVELPPAVNTKNATASAEAPSDDQPAKATTTTSSTLTAAAAKMDEVRQSFGCAPNSSEELTLQFTLVDCPGHASLIRAVMGAAHIIDLMILVIDITKGIQPQTAECIVLGEMLGRKLIVVLNKVDMITGDTEEERRLNIDKRKKALRAVFSKTRWPNAPFVEVAANPASTSAFSAPVGIDTLKRTLTACAARMARSKSLMSVARSSGKLDPQHFFMMVDHCFGVKGHGTVLTGTVVGGTVGIGDEVKIPDLGLSRRVKSIQVFRKPVEVAHCGDRIGLCITQVQADRLERGIACSAHPNSPVLTIQHACVCAIAKVRFHKGEIESSSMNFHVTIGHVTAMATMKFFSLSHNRRDQQKQSATAAAASSSSSSSSRSSSSPFGEFDFATEFEYEDKITDSAVLQLAPPAENSNPEDAVAHVPSDDKQYYAVLLLDRPVTAVVGSMVICSHLDGTVGGAEGKGTAAAASTAQQHQQQVVAAGGGAAGAAAAAASSSSSSNCRLAMHGVLLTGEIGASLPGADKEDVEAWRGLKVVRYRERGINIDKIQDARTVIARPAKQVEGGPLPMDLTKYVGAPVIFRKKVREPRPPKNNNSAKTSGGGQNDDDDDVQSKKDAQAAARDNADNNPPAHQQRQPPPRYVETRGKIESVVGGTGGKVKVTFASDVFEGNRAFGSILMVDKKYPFSIQYKHEWNN